MKQVDATWDAESDDAVVIDSLLRDRVIRSRLIVAVPEADVCRYELAEEKRAGIPHWDPTHGAWATAWGDMGTKYEDAGGAAGVSEDGNLVEGKADFRPAPPGDATWVELVYPPWHEENADDQSEFVLRIPLP